MQEVWKIPMCFYSDEQKILIELTKKLFFRKP